jgi:uncharacterized protein YmfQ (DUF2313 family)
MRLIGPHEGYEWEMMAAGVKPAALTPLHGKLNRFWIDLAKEAGYSWRVIDNCHNAFDSITVCLPGEEWRMNRLAKTYKKIRTKTHHMSKVDHAKIGLCLGYSKPQIRAFLERI